MIIKPSMHLENIAMFHFYLNLWLLAIKYFLLFTKYDLNEMKPVEVKWSIVVSGSPSYWRYC